VQKFLGHSDPGFTLRTYVHLLPGDLPEPLESPAAAPLERVEPEVPALAEVTNRVTTRPTEISRDQR
jgi:hypothetical protein